ncbi:MAG: glycosyltransferase family 2 protein [Flavobacteriaceae bacterium]
MKSNSPPTVNVIIPAHNEEKSIGKVIAALPPLINEVVVVNNNSTDRTAQNAQAAGATVLHENKRGYGHACLKGIDYLKVKAKPTDILVFLDGDFSDYPEQATQLVAPILTEEVDFVLGARVKWLRETGALTPQQIFGNGLACFLMRRLFQSTFTDLGPFRAIRWNRLEQLNMSDKTYGWTVEMQLKVLRQKIPYREIPVAYRKRIGVSKVSGTVKGTILAGVKIIGWIFKHYLS